MFTFNDYQYFSYIEEIYNYMINNPEETKNAIKVYYGDRIKTKSKKPAFIRGMQTGAVIAECATLLASLITQNPEIISRFMPSCLGVFTGSTLASLIFQERKESSLPEDIYYRYVEDTAKDFTFGETFIPNDDQIHEMTIALNGGERDEKYSRMDLYGKCPVTICSEIDGNTERYWNLPLKDGAVSRMYEVAMHFAAEPKEGYEDVLREIYSLIKRYIHASYSKDKTEAESIYEEFEELRSNHVEKRGR